MFIYPNHFTDTTTSTSTLLSAKTVNDVQLKLLLTEIYEIARYLLIQSRPMTSTLTSDSEPKKLSADNGQYLRFTFEKISHVTKFGDFNYRNSFTL